MSAAVTLTVGFVTVTLHVVLTFVDTFPFIVIVAVPSATPVTVPSCATVAIFVAPDVYVKSSTNPLGVVVTFIFPVPFFPTVKFSALIAVTFCTILTVHVSE